MQLLLTKPLSKDAYESTLVQSAKSNNELLFKKLIQLHEYADWLKEVYMDLAAITCKSKNKNLLPLLLAKHPEQIKNSSEEEKQYLILALCKYGRVGIIKKIFDMELIDRKIISSKFETNQLLNLALGSKSPKLIEFLFDNDVSYSTEILHYFYRHFINNMNRTQKAVDKILWLKLSYDILNIFVRQAIQINHLLPETHPLTTLDFFIIQYLKTIDGTKYLYKNIIELLLQTNAQFRQRMPIINRAIAAKDLELLSLLLEYDSLNEKEILILKKLFDKDVDTANPHINTIREYLSGPSLKRLTIKACMAKLKQDIFKRIKYLFKDLPITATIDNINNIMKINAYKNLVHDEVCQQFIDKMPDENTLKEIKRYGKYPPLWKYIEAKEGTQPVDEVKRRKKS